MAGAQRKAAVIPYRIRKNRVEVGYAVVDHRLRVGAAEVLGVRGERSPDQRLASRRAEHGAVPVLDVETKVLGVPRRERCGVARTQEYTADPGHTLHRPQHYDALAR